MSIEATLGSIDTSLKALVALLQNAGTLTHLAAPAVEKKTRTKKGEQAAAAETPATTDTPAVVVEAEAPAATQPAPVVDGDPAGTRYWVSEELQTAYAQKPGDPDPQPQSFRIESADGYLSKKAEFAAKKAQADVVTTDPVTAATAPTATAPAATASAETSATPEVTWKEVLTALQAVNKSTKPGHGRDGILALLKQFGCEGKTVPAMEALGQHAAILAATNAMLSASEAGADDLGLGL